MSKPPLTTKRFGDAVGISVSTVHRLEKQGVIRAVRDFRGWRRFSPNEVIRLRRLLGWEILDAEAGRE